MRKDADLIYKILSQADWAPARRDGVFRGAPVDLADGFIHFSTRDQLAETVRRHFAGSDDLVLLGVDPGALEDLRYEPSRGGALFPHLYGAMPVSAVRREAPLSWNGPEPALPDWADTKKDAT